MRHRCESKEDRVALKVRVLGGKGNQSAGQCLMSAWVFLERDKNEDRRATPLISDNSITSGAPGSLSDSVSKHGSELTVVGITTSCR